MFGSKHNKLGPYPFEVILLNPYLQMNQMMMTTSSLTVKRMLKSFLQQETQCSLNAANQNTLCGTSLWGDTSAVTT